MKTPSSSNCWKTIQIYPKILSKLLKKTISYLWDQFQHKGRSLRSRRTPHCSPMEYGGTLCSRVVMTYRWTTSSTDLNPHLNKEWRRSRRMPHSPKSRSSWPRIIWESSERLWTKWGRTFALQWDPIFPLHRRSTTTSYRWEASWTRTQPAALLTDSGYKSWRLRKFAVSKTRHPYRTEKMKKTTDITILSWCNQ